MTPLVQRRQSHHLHLVLPQNGPGVRAAQTLDHHAKLSQQPRHVQGVTDVLVRNRPKPTHTAALSASSGSIVQSVRGVQLVIEPVHFAAQVTHAPVVTQISGIIPDVMRRLKNTSPKTRIPVAFGRLESDIHGGSPRCSRAFFYGREKATDHPRRTKQSDGVGWSAFACLKEEHWNRPLDKSRSTIMPAQSKRAIGGNIRCACGSKTTAPSFSKDEVLK